MLGFLHYQVVHYITNASVQTVPLYVTKTQELKLVIYIVNYCIFDTFLPTCRAKKLNYIIRVCVGHTLWRVWIPEDVKWL